MGIENASSFAADEQHDAPGTRERRFASVDNWASSGNVLKKPKLVLVIENYRREIMSNSRHECLENSRYFRFTKNYIGALGKPV